LEAMGVGYATTDTSGLLKVLDLAILFLSLLNSDPHFRWTCLLQKRARHGRLRHIEIVAKPIMKACGLPQA
jgi:hypothetical protein